MIHRTIFDDMWQLLQKQRTDTKKKVIVVYGPRQVGKTTLAEHILSRWSNPPKAAFYNCDYLDVQETFAYDNAQYLSSVVQGLELLILDEAQRIKNIGLVLKILADQHPHVQVIATGSSSFELSNQVSEPLTGRKHVFYVFPFSYKELYHDKAVLERQRSLAFHLRFGYYPDVVTQDEANAKQRLMELASSYLFKDIFAFERLKKPELLQKLLKLLALQLGHEVSFTELSGQLGVDQTVVQHYLHLLEEAFVVFRLPAFQRNLRNEIKKSRKVYFWDLGIRNTIIQNWNALDIRDDTGSLWENFCIAERMKHLHNERRIWNSYFWRTYGQKEIDYIEEQEGQLLAYEFKWSTNKNPRCPLAFQKAYPQAEFKGINPQNLDDLLML